MSNADAGILHADADFEANLERSEPLHVVPTELHSIAATAQFDPSQSYGQTRAALESEFESRYVSWLLARQNGNLSAAAREARMDRKHLHDLAKKHGLRSSKVVARP